MEKEPRLVSVYQIRKYLQENPAFIDQVRLIERLSEMGQTVRNYREEQGLSRKKLAKKAGIEKKGVSAIEEAKVEDIRLDEITALARVMGMRLIVSLEEKGPKASSDK